MIAEKLRLPVDSIESVFVFRKRNLGSQSAVVRTTDRKTATDLRIARTMEDWKIYPDSGPVKLKENFIFKNIRTAAPAGFSFMYWKGIAMVINNEKMVWAPYNVWQHTKDINPGTPASLHDMDTETIKQRIEYALRSPTPCPSDLRIPSYTPTAHPSNTNAWGPGRGAGRGGGRGGRGGRGVPLSEFPALTSSSVRRLPNTETTRDHPRPPVTTPAPDKKSRATSVADME